MASPLPVATMATGSWNNNQRAQFPLLQQSQTQRQPFLAQASAPETGGLQTRVMGLKVHYTFDTQAKIHYLARYPQTLPIQTFALNESNTIGIIDLRLCVQAVMNCSPEIEAYDCDFTMYTLDYSEADTPLVGHGLLSWILHSMRNESMMQQPRMITGRVTRHLMGVFTGNTCETLEVRLRLTSTAKRGKPINVGGPEHQEHNGPKKGTFAPPAISPPAIAPPVIAPPAIAPPAIAPPAIAPQGIAEWNPLMQSNTHIAQDRMQAGDALRVAAPPPKRKRKRKLMGSRLRGRPRQNQGQGNTSGCEEATESEDGSAPKRIATGSLPRGRPCKEQCEDNTSGCEEATESEDGPADIGSSPPAQRAAATFVRSSLPSTPNLPPMLLNEFPPEVSFNTDDLEDLFGEQQPTPAPEPPENQPLQPPRKTSTRMSGAEDRSMSPRVVGPTPPATTDAMEKPASPLLTAESAMNGTKESTPAAASGQTADPADPSCPAPSFATKMKRAVSTGTLTLPIPASDPIVPIATPSTTTALPDPTAAAAAKGDAVAAPSSPRTRSNKNIAKKHAIKQRLEEAIMKGEMPPYCRNCGAIETPTWRKIWTQDKEGVPEYCEYSVEAGRVTAIEILQRDADDRPSLHRLIKKSLGPEDDRDQWRERLLCNPCGIWLAKCKSHRPQDRWDKDASRLGQERRKRGPGRGTSQSKKSQSGGDGSMNLTSEANMPTDDFDEAVGDTRRRLFPSPRGEGVLKTLNEPEMNTAQAVDDCQPKTQDSGKENMATMPLAGADDTDHDEVYALLRYTAAAYGRPSTPPPNGQQGTPKEALKTPTRPTPPHRPITRSVSRSVKSLRSAVASSSPLGGSRRRSPRSHSGSWEAFETPVDLSMFDTEFGVGVDNPGGMPGVMDNWWLSVPE